MHPTGSLWREQDLCSSFKKNKNLLFPHLLCLRSSRSKCNAWAISHMFFFFYTLFQIFILKKICFVFRRNATPKVVILMGWSVLLGWDLGRTARRPSTAKTAGSCSRTASVTSSATPRDASMMGLTVWWGELIVCYLHLCLHVCLPPYSVCECQCLPLCVCVYIFVFLSLREREMCVWGGCVCVRACMCMCAYERECMCVCAYERESGWVGVCEREGESLLVYAEILHMFCLNKAVITAVALNWFRTCCGNEWPWWHRQLQNVCA